MGSFITRPALAAWLALACWPCAEAFQVRPVRLDLGSRATASQLVVHNPTSRPLVLQAEVFDWAQNGGMDELAPSRSLIVNPPIVEIAPSASQVVRVGLRGPVEAGVERSHRVWLSQVPSPDAGDDGVQLLLRVSLPVFVTGAGTAAPRPSWRLEDHALRLQNDGGRHVQVRSLKLVAGDGRSTVLGPCYALPSSHCRWRLPDGWSGGALRLEADSDAGVLREALDAPAIR